MSRYAWDVYRAAARARWIGRVGTADEAKSSRGTGLHASPDLVDDDAVVLIPFAVADAGLENLSVQPRERQVLSDLARLRNMSSTSLRVWRARPSAEKSPRTILGPLVSMTCE